MRKIVHRVFWAWSSEKEEKWLNRMAAQGLCLVSYGFCRYEFEECLPGEYEIRIELLEHNPCHPVSQQYISFLEETGAEQVGSWCRWVYFRKKTDAGRFELFSDRPSRIQHLNRILRLIGVVGGLNLWVGGYNIFLALLWDHSFNLVGIFNLALGALSAVGFAKIFKQKQRLKKELTLFE